MKCELQNITTRKSTELDAISGTVGPDVLDISHPARDLGVFTYDPGFWAEAGVATPDSAMFDIAMPLFETEDVRRCIPAAVEALKTGRPRPALNFQGRKPEPLP